MRSFKHFPKEVICPICGTNDNKTCILIAVNGTSDGKIVEAHPFHVGCLQSNLTYYPDEKAVAVYAPHTR